MPLITLVVVILLIAFAFWANNRWTGNATLKFWFNVLLFLLVVCVILSVLGWLPRGNVTV